MKQSANAWLGACVSAIAGFAGGLPVCGAPPSPAAAERFDLGLRGVYFVENQGQWSDASVHYGLKSRGLDVAFRESSFTMHLSREVERASRPFEHAIASEASPKRERGCSAFDDPDPLPHGRGSLREPTAYEHLTLTVSFPGSNAVTPRGAQPQTAKFNYFVGGEGRGIASNVPSFGAVIYENLYNGIDLLVCGNDDGVMKYEFHCAPGADYSQIRIHYDGIDPLCVNADGDLEIATSFGTLRDGAPIVWQEDAGGTEAGGTVVPAIEQQCGGTAVPTVQQESGGTAVPAVDSGSMGVPPVDQSAGAMTGRDARSTGEPGNPTLSACFELIDAYTYRMALDGPVDPACSLVIDPDVEWMYYFGGTGSDYVQTMAVDRDDHILLTGWTDSIDFDGRGNEHFGGAFDAFLLKADPAGALQWMSFFGGSDAERGYGLAVGSGGEAFVVGPTRSVDFHGRANAHFGGSYDGFALKVDESGLLQWMIYVGGTGDESPNAVVTDHADFAVVAGETDSIDFTHRSNEFRGGISDAFVIRIDTAGSPDWMAYVGGGGQDGALGVNAAAQQRLLLTGLTDSPDFDGRTNSPYGQYDIFVSRLDPAGAVEWMTYFGGSRHDMGYLLLPDVSGDVFVAAMTESEDFHGRGNSYYGGERDAVILRLSPIGTLKWMLHIGGSGRERARALARQRDGSLLLSAGTTSVDFSGQINPHHGGEYDAWVASVDPDGSLRWTTFLGGSGDDWGRGVHALDSGHILVGGMTTSPDFEGGQNTYHGGDLRDGFVARLLPEPGPQLGVAATCPSGGPIQIEWSGASPGGQVALIFARNTGSFIIPNNRPCAGTQLGLGSNQIQLAWQGDAGADGSRVLNTTAGPGACGGYLQLLDLATCATSNVVQID